MAKLFSKSRLEPYEWVTGLIVAVDEVTSDGRVDIKITNDRFQIILHLHRSEFEKLIQQYRKLQSDSDRRCPNPSKPL